MLVTGITSYLTLRLLVIRGFLDIYPNRNVWSWRTVFPITYSSCVREATKRRAGGGFFFILTRNCAARIAADNGPFYTFD